MGSGRLLVLASAICFGTTGTTQALGVPGAPPVAVGAGRIAVGAAGLLLVAWWLARSARPARRRLPLRPEVLVGALGVAAYQPAFFLAVKSTGVAVGTVVALGSAPVITGALAPLAGQGRPDRRWATATALAAAGLVILTVGGGAAEVRVTGVLLAVGAATSYAAYTLSVKRLLDGGTPPETAIATVFAGGAVLLAPLLFVLPVAWMATPRGAAEVAFLGLVPTTLAYVLFVRGLRSVTAAETATLTLAEPLTAAALGVLVLDEHLAPATVAGGVLLLAGLIALGHRRTAREETAGQQGAEPVAGLAR